MPPIVYVPVAPLAQPLSPVLRYPFPSSHRSGLPFGETYQVIRFWVTDRSALLRPIQAFSIVWAILDSNQWSHARSRSDPVALRESWREQRRLSTRWAVAAMVDSAFPACRGGCCGGVWEDLLRAREDGYDDRCYVEGRVKSGPLTVRSIRSKATLSKGATQCQRPSGWIPASDQ